MKITVKKLTICSLMFFALSMMFSFSTVMAQKMTSATQAKNAALKKVPSATVTEVDTDMDNGVLVYGVELYKGNKEYKLEYRASDSKLIKYEWEISHPAVTNQNKANLSKSAIKNKALNKVKNATVVSTNLTTDNGMAVYKVRLTKGKKSYKLEYNSKTGKLLEYQWEIVASTKTASTTSASSTSTSSTYIGTAKAKAIALEKVPNATIVKVKLDTDDGVAVYEVEMVKGIYEYELKINAKTGKIIEFEKDIDD